MEVLDRKFLEYVEKMPSFSPTVSKITELANNPSSSPKDLVAVIRMDPVLTVKILKLINSAYFGMRQEITSLNRAAILLGINTLKNVALSTAVLGAFAQKDETEESLAKFGFDIDSFWLHSLGCAAASKTLAGHLRIPQEMHEEFFIAGLLHDIGKVLYLKFLPNELAVILSACRAKGATFYEEEKRHVQMTHPRAGGLLAEKWKFAPALREAIELHHEPNLSSASAKLSAAVFTADNYCRRNSIGFAGSNKVDEVSPEVWKFLGLDEEKLRLLFSELEFEIEKAKVFLKTSGA